jgi:hypothetical protein
MEAFAADGSKDGDGIKQVTFTISDQGGMVYQHTEKGAPYCIFGDSNRICNSWSQASGTFTWGENGPQVNAGQYLVEISAEPNSANGDSSLFGYWQFSIQVELP